MTLLWVCYVRIHLIPHIELSTWTHSLNAFGLIERVNKNCITQPMVYIYRINRNCGNNLSVVISDLIFAVKEI